MMSTTFNVGSYLFCCLVGNTVIIKPSEIAQEFATVLAKVVPQYLDNVS